MTDSRHLRDELLANCPSLSPVAIEILSEMYTAKTLPGTKNPAREIGIEKIAIVQGAELHRLIRETNAKSTIEIGFAYGFSAVWMLDALSMLAGVRHLAIDPFEESHWDGVGITQVQRLGLEKNSFEWIGDKSIHALSDLIEQSHKADFIFIDGNHRFDDVLVDFYLSDMLLRDGGCIAFDDLWMDSIAAVVDFVETNRSYAVVEQKAPNMKVFRKEAEDARNWQHFVPFKSHRRRDGVTMALKKLATKLRRT